ncbi:hypothetical protein CesoFtcFv8_002648 [Champsocephalus esox]|nr:hypothetical protein CesoFtcFv8_002648 [Champsocephalus esox]
METNVPEQEFGNGRGLVKKCRDAVLQNSYLATVISAVVLGITLGLVLKFYIHISDHNKQYIDIPGKILMDMVQLMTVPLLLTNLITGASGFKAHRVIDGRATAYFLSTTLMSLSIGIFLVMMFEPGSSPSVEG